MDSPISHLNTCISFTLTGNVRSMLALGGVHYWWRGGGQGMVSGLVRSGQMGRCRACPPPPPPGVSVLFHLTPITHLAALIGFHPNLGVFPWNRQNSSSTTSNYWRNLLISQHWHIHSGLDIVESLTRWKGYCVISWLRGISWRQPSFTSFAIFVRWWSIEIVW